MDGVFLGLAGRLLDIPLGLRPQEIPQSSPASPWKTLSIPPLLLGLTQYLEEGKSEMSCTDYLRTKEE